MRHILFCYLIVFSFKCSFAQALTVGNLCCEYKQDPVGIDNIQPHLSWQLLSSEKNILQTAYQVMVSDDSLSLIHDTADIWNSNKIVSAASIQVAYAGKPLQATKKYYWKVKVWDNKDHVSPYSNIASWQMGLLTKADWKNAQWIAYDILPDSNKIIPAVHGNGDLAWGQGKDILPLFRKAFTIYNTVKRATVFISGLGHFELSINGKKTGDHFLDPGWTKYDKHALYVSFDVTNQLKQGSNAMGVTLGNGFYYIPRERYRKLTGAFGYPKMICRLLVEYADGTSENIVSDASWKTAPSPTIFSSIYGGEDYDATMEQHGWDSPDFNDVSWKKVVLTEGPALEAQYEEPLKIMQVLPVVKKTKLKDDVWVYDIAQNMSGIPELTVKGKKGDTVKIITAELLKEDGTVNQQATGKPNFYQYILKGDSIETWHPKFTYYGFRYIQVEKAVPANESNAAGLPVVVDLKGLHIRNAAAEAGTFTCSNELFNKTHQLIDWAIRSNMVSVFTDCPHREKLGWLEEAHLMGSSVKSRYNIAALGRKVVRDMIISQTADGLIPDIAPEYVQFVSGFRDSPEWGSCGVLLPWYLYQWYGDKQVLQESYNMMQRYVAYLEKKSDNHILSYGLGDWFDLGPNSPGESQLTPKGVTATAIYYYDLYILSKIAKILNKPEDAAKYNKWGEAVKLAFNNKFFNSTTKQYGTGSQTANAIAVYMKLVNDKDKAAVVNNIVKDLRNRNNALTAGDIGFRYLLKVLDEAGRSDVIFDMNNRSDVPGYGYQLAHGATALTESWQALAVVSNNHFMLGHIMEWFYAGLAGISEAEDAVGYNKIVIRPQVVGDVTYAKASFQSPYGLISSDWKAGDTFELNVTIPVNTTAVVYLPVKNTSVIMKDNKLIKPLTIEHDKALVAIGSGSYQFMVK
ncbi:alpha-L-rhamnosidase [Ilyomonas limi]|uniref:alpha-L-rhamnosidase n=1 Tax=Ilyomonas limi TaxID=2575867 RepID=A0A4U3L7J4_9BACT|nr:family 78 glycoside hydrolase catalytic domain [Ilyomonas limi]TKK71040.1 alpha-L-rhamnosidase [Ilyomonas limi]